MLGSRIAVIVADIIVLGLTWNKTFKSSIRCLRSGMKISWSSILLRDGSCFLLSIKSNLDDRTVSCNRDSIFWVSLVHLQTVMLTAHLLAHFLP